MEFNRSSRMFQWANGLLLGVVAFTMIAPLLHLAAVSLSAPVYAGAKLVYLWPRGFNVNVYRSIFRMEQLWRALEVTALVTVLGTALHLALTSTMAYGLSRPKAPAKKLIMRFILVTFIFTLPLIPNYLWIRTLGMENTLLALFVPGAASAFGVIIMKTFFQQMSSELFDAGKIDGCSEFGLYARLALPLSKAVIATLALFQAVGLWNAYFAALIYIRNKELYPLQVLLRSLIVQEDNRIGGAAAIREMVTPEMMKAGVVIFATLPILCVYPFLQKHFVKGAMLGSLKD
ncbi:carbohydrate ABC transporter permease [Paenibacillus cymbidii]|uniref:carbohydrate ABC transporter permease n=1 Tax=Paenibacillus cymbidii TaxID=1639034 RepID=UPI00107FF8A2|nr:carbohydrate ABC transporter permease [Paenibacillus cymbidii]